MRRRLVKRTVEWDELRTQLSIRTVDMTGGLEGDLSQGYLHLHAAQCVVNALLLVTRLRSIRLAPSMCRFVRHVLC